ncbi:MAG: hypothetical protein JXA23_08290, partial [Bacteroidales bacterium]|nr:hypothetical protein [Bacteroidales bacterium]
MNLTKRLFYLPILVMGLIGMITPQPGFSQSCDSVSAPLKPQVVRLNLHSSEYQELFHGAPQT